MIVTRQGRHADVRVIVARASAVVLAFSAAGAVAGGSAENVILIIDPSNQTSIYVGNYYKNARSIPDANVLYMSSGASSYATFTNTNQSAFTGSLTQRQIDDHADYVTIAPFNGFYVPYAGEPTGPGTNITCGTPRRYSLSAAYTLAQVSADFVNNDNPYQPNQFFGGPALGFSSNQGYLNGAASTDPAAKKYYISALLGYTLGSWGNTPQELLAMIDRSVAVDGAGGNRGGTFYYMNNTADPPRDIRACGSSSNCADPKFYNAAATHLRQIGYPATVSSGVLPPNGSIALGVMTGSATLAIPGSSFGVAPGAFADHLTSWGALFDCTSGCQTPISAWISQGASGSDGTVEEPCADTRIFPTADFHTYYARGMSIGESYLRSLATVPTHNLLYGDPLTHAFASLPSVTVAPYSGSQSGVIAIAPSVTPAPGTVIVSYDLLVDGVKMASAVSGSGLSLDTRQVPDGRHDLRVLAYDNTPVRSVGRWIGTLDTLNYGHGATLSVSPASGDLAQRFSFAYSATGGVVTEVRLLQNQRVLAAATSGAGTMTVYGQNLGAGISHLQLEASFADGHLARSIPVSTSVSFSGTPTGHVPIAYNYSKSINSPTAFVVELPASFDTAPDGATYAVLNSLTNATILQSDSSPRGPYRIVQPLPGATGSEQLRFKVTTAAGTSNEAAVTLVY